MKTTLCARDVMTTRLVVARTNTPIDEVAELLTLHHISAVPVVDEQGELAGIVSSTDLLPSEKKIPFSSVKAPVLFSEFVDPDKPLDETYREALGHTAADAMTPHVVTVNANDDLEHVAHVLMRDNVRQVPVLEHGKLAGIVTRKDLLRALFGMPRSS
jgi:CBS domain-containing protein